MIIDSDLEDSFNAIMEARDYILIAGSEVHAAEMREMLHEMSIPNGDAAVKILDDKNLTNFERFALLREFVSHSVYEAFELWVNDGRILALLCYSAD